MKNYFVIIVVTISFFCCKTKSKADEKAKEIIEKCVKTHGGDNYLNLNVRFDFRKFNVKIIQNKTNFIYSRTQKDSLNNEILDVLTNSSFERKINQKPIVISEKDAAKYKEATNSIAYFALLPYKLLEPAVIAKYLGVSNINGQNYDKIKVSFTKEGGGKDHDDVFCYWINQKTSTLDYLAYDNGGPRFRKAYNRYEIDGVLFQDYENYEIADTLVSTSDYDKIFLNGKAKLLSKINQINYQSGK
jgi:hypothetical protein